MMSNIPLNKYLETLAKVGGAVPDLRADETAPIARRLSYDNYAALEKSRRHPYRYGRNEGKIYAHGGRKGSYEKPSSALNYKMWYVPGAIVQRAVMEKELKGWTPIFPDNIWLNRDLPEESNAKEEEVVAHERTHRKDWSKEEIDVRKEMQGWLLTYRGTIADTLHEARYA